MDETLLETIGEFTLPRPNSEGDSFFKTYTRPVGEVSGARLSILLEPIPDDGPKTLEALSVLPNALGLLISPYSSALAQYQDFMLMRRQELWVSMPVEQNAEAAQQIDPGPRALMARQSLQNNLANLHWCLSRAKAYTGVAFASGPSFAYAKPVMASLLRDMAKRGVALIDLSPSGLDYLKINAAEVDLPFAHVSLPTPSIDTAEGFEDHLALIESAALSNESVMVRLPFYPSLEKPLRQWLESLSAKNIALVPPSSFFKSDEKSAEAPEPANQTASEH